MTATTRPSHLFRHGSLYDASYGDGVLIQGNQAMVIRHLCLAQSQIMWEFYVT